MRAETLGLSIAGHLVLGLVLASLATHERARPPAPPATIELVDAPPSPSPPPPPSASTAGGAGGASSARARPAPRPRAMVEEDPRGQIRIDGDEDGHAGPGAGHGRGSGDGPGVGLGTGIGLGDGAKIAEDSVALITPPPPPASKARAAKLVYPTRQREVDDSELFVARVTIDDEGFVVGAKLVRGFGGPRDAMAADLIWKFRYAPALDDEGRPIRSTFEQRFLVGR